jgi:hypothetical protein
LCHRLANQQSIAAPMSWTVLRAFYYGKITTRYPFVRYVVKVG